MIPDKHQKAESKQGDPARACAHAWGYHRDFGWTFFRLPSHLTVKACRAETHLLAFAEYFGMVQEVAEGDWRWWACSKTGGDADGVFDEGRAASEGEGKFLLLCALTRGGVIDAPRLIFPVIRKLDVVALQATAALLTAKPQGHA